jgi:DNA-binding transcriptional ArsR family regulator
MDRARVEVKQIKNVYQKLRILSVETRLRMLVLLSKRRLCVSAISCRLGLTQGAVSQHLKILREEGLVIAERLGYYIYYRVDERALADWIEEIDGLLQGLSKEAATEYKPLEAQPTQCIRQR